MMTTQHLPATAGTADAMLLKPAGLAFSHAMHLFMATGQLTSRQPAAVCWIPAEVDEERAIFRP
jgi:hypothetical protein